MSDSLKSGVPPGLPPKRKRYWSVMLVGEHGRVIPLRHFNLIVMLILLILALSLTGLGVLGAGYWQSRHVLDQVRAERDDLRQHVAQLRDEKDVLLAKRVIEAIHSDPPEPMETLAAGPDEERHPVTTEIQAATETDAATHPEPREVETAPAPEVPWQAEIRHFEATYQPGAEEIRISFQIHNATTPRQTLAGAIVVVFEHAGDPGVERLPVPAVELRNGVPSGDGGQAFRINNYRTMRFRVAGQTIPIPYNQVSVFVFEKEGTHLLTRQFEIDMPGEPEAISQPLSPASDHYASVGDGSSPDGENRNGPPSVTLDP